MLSQDNKRAGLPSEAALAGLCAVLALSFLLGGDRLVGIERGFYDLCQRLSATATKAPVVIVSVDSATPDLWAVPRLDELITAVKAAGARAIIPAAPAPPLVGTDDVSRLRALIRLEESGGALQSRSEPGLLLSQLAEAEQRIGQQERVAAAVLAAGNVVLGLPTTERRPGGSPGTGICAERVTAASARLAVQDNSWAKLATLAPAAPILCEAAAAIGHVALLTDRDGVVRRAAPVLTTDAGNLPSSAQATAALESGTEGAVGTLARFYQSPDGAPGFPVISAVDALSGRASGALRDRYVVIGRPEGGSSDSVRTPMASNSGAAVLIATDLANYLSQEHVRRPAWAIWVEIGLALLLAGAAVVIGRLGLPKASLLAVSGMLLLLLAEYLLVDFAGLWLQFAGLALFCLTGVAILQFIMQLSRRSRGLTADGTGQRSISPAGTAEELDLGFSVLRQQPTTERTKSQLYELAMEHGRKRNYAKAERVFRHLAARDPGYRDVETKL